MEVISATIEPITCSIPTALLLSGLGKTTLYERINDGSIRAVKYKKRTLIFIESLRAWLNTLPSVSNLNTESGQ